MNTALEIIQTAFPGIEIVGESESSAYAIGTTNKYLRVSTHSAVCAKSKAFAADCELIFQLNYDEDERKCYYNLHSPRFNWEIENVPGDRLMYFATKMLRSAYTNRLFN